MQKFFKKIGDSYEDYEINYRIHATRRMFQRNIDNSDVEKVIKEGIVIEQYEDDLPFPSFLISGKTNHGDPLHVVASLNINERILYVITVYYPDPIKWVDEYSRREK